MSIRRTEKAKSMGADACLVIFPYYNRPSFDGCMEHFSAIAAVGLPVIVYHHPGRTGIKCSAEQLKRICEISGVIGLKESAGDLTLIADFISICSTPVFSGDDALTIPIIVLGGKGAISVAANAIPCKFAQMVELCLAGHFSEAREIFLKISPFCQSLFLDTNPQGIKYAVSLLTNSAYNLRLPLVRSSEEIQNHIKRTLFVCDLKSVTQLGEILQNHLRM
jgi:4-hydroxy-tetrahydrodipicolinate synthase